MSACAFLIALSGCSSVQKQYEDPDSLSYDGTPGSYILATAMTQHGVPYKYGKHRPQDGFDCSGLIYWAYQENGMSVPRSTSSQAKAGRRVTASEAKQGDIVIFNVKGRLHNGLVAGDGKFLHSPSSGGRVRLESIYDPYWKKRVVGFRRIVPHS